MAKTHAEKIAANLTVGQWLVLEGPRKFGSPTRASEHAQALTRLALIESPAQGPNRQWAAAWPLTALGKEVMALKPVARRSALAETAKRAFDRNSERREKASVAQLRKMIDPWDAVIAAVYDEIEQMVRGKQRPDKAEGGQSND